MSHIATNWALGQRGLEPVTKILLWRLSDCHNGKTGQCNPSQKRLAEDCEISRATVNRHLDKLERAGLICRVQSLDHRTRKQQNTSYILAFETDNSVSQEEQNPCLKSDESRVSNCDTNLGREPGKEMCVGDANAHTQEFFEEFWQVYPRPRGLDRTANMFSKIVATGIDPRWIVQAAGKFAAENAGNLRMYLPYADNWLKEKRWEDFPQSATTDQSYRNQIEEQALFWAKRIKTATYISPGAISEQVLKVIIKEGLASSINLRRLGFVP